MFVDSLIEQCRSRWSRIRRHCAWVLFVFVALMLSKTYDQERMLGILDFASVMTKPLTNESSKYLSTTLGHEVSINDRTIRLDPNIPRPWLDTSKISSPPYKLILTDIGWNHPNTTVGLTFSRILRSRELMQGLVDHPYFDPTVSWSKVVKGEQMIDPNTQHYVFLDIESCFESNYPYYGGGFLKNSDVKGGRIALDPWNHPCFNLDRCQHVVDVLDTVHKFPNMMLVVYNCRGLGPGAVFRKSVTSMQLSLVAESMPEAHALPEVDQGLAPGALNVVKLRPDELEAVNSCNDTDRPFLVTFVGMNRPGPRTAMLHNMSNGRDVIFMDKGSYQEKYFFLSFQETLKKSMFGATPKGDNLYSYRFTEVLSAGSIPVIHADGWLMPFHRALIDWNDTCAVVLPESQVYETERILRSMSKEERCRRQRNCIEIYNKYFATSHGTVKGIIDGLERIRERKNLSSYS